MSNQIVKGNTAVIIGALYAGCDCFFGYPITPASEILHEASKYFPMVGRKFVQAESEEASVNMIYGGASTGHRVMSASSGPGISLMQEGFTFLAGAELPAVIVDVMRAGPGLGNIGPEQGDYNQIVKGGGHGNYRNIVLAPNSVQEMCDFTMKAFELSTKYRNPVVVLADAVLGQMAEPLRFPKEAIEPKIDESWAVRTIRQNEVVYEEYMVEDAEIVIVAYGTSSRLSRTAVDVAREKGIKLGLLRPITLFPFPEKRIKELADNGVQFVSVEMSNGQLREDVKAAANYDDVHLVNRMGGNVIELKDILNEIYKMVGSDERHKVHSDEKDYDASYLNDKEYQEELDNDNYYNHRVVD